MTFYHNNSIVNYEFYLNQLNIYWDVFNTRDKKNISNKIRNKQLKIIKNEVPLNYVYDI